MTVKKRGERRWRANLYKLKFDLFLPPCVLKCISPRNLVQFKVIVVIQFFYHSTHYV